MGLPETEDQGFITTLLARRDRFLVPGETGTPPEGASDLVILLHPGYERGIGPAWFPERYLAAVESGSTTDYKDPVVSLNDESAQEYEGRWAVSFAPVADSRFVVLIQQHYAPAVTWEVWLLLTLILTAICLTLATRMVRWVDTRRVGPTDSADGSAAGIRS